MNSVTKALLIMAVISFAIQFIFPAYGEALVFDVTKISELWRFVTAIFIHGNIIHLLVNLYGLYLVGSVIETKIKIRDYLTIFLIGGILGYVGHLVNYILGNFPYQFGLGMSGATASLLAASVVLAPDVKVCPFLIPVKLKHLALLFFAVELIAFMLGDTTFNHPAHLLGGLFGIIYARFFVKLE